jgi:SpoVK/Ycf46/Vps4 family AAA+-type ATPase
VAEDPLIASLLDAVGRAPDDVPLRLHLAGLLLAGSRAAEALEHCATAYRLAPDDPAAAALLASISAVLMPSSPSLPSEPEHSRPFAADGPDNFDWRAAEQQMDRVDVVPEPGPEPDALIERPAVTMADVGGMEHVKAEIRSSFLIPMANPELRAAYGASLGGGLLLYGPPGCGKTFLARAVAGELGAGFVAVSLADVLDMWLGTSERNVKALFGSARAHRPSVIFLDEIDAIGQRRTNLRNNPAMRGTVNQLLSEMDGATSDNDGVFVLAATNQPWDVDPALRRPGRFDRVLFVSPPDLDARVAILKFHLRDRPLGPLDLNRLARETEGYSGADLAQLCAVATRTALADAAATGKVRPVMMSDLDPARKQVKPTTGEWLATARNAATFANLDGTYDELDEYLKRRRR